MLKAEKLDQVLNRFNAVQAELASGPEGDAFVQLSKEYAELSPVAGKVQALRDAEEERAGLEEMLADPDADKEMTALARDEMDVLAQAIEALEDEIQILLLPKDAADERNVILEVRAGTGGDEAAIFAGDLFRMYQRYAESKGWKFEVVEATESGHGGFREAVANISGKGPYAMLKFESGVHRVQRVPETESQGRIHTSAATVAVLPEAERELVTFVVRSIREPEEIASSDVQRLRDLGWCDSDIFDATFQGAFMLTSGVLFNTFKMHEE